MHENLPRPMLILVGLLLAGCSGSSESSFHFTGAVSDLRIPASEIPGNRTGPSGIVIDDLSNLADLPVAQKAVGEQLAKQMAPVGITACADFTYMNPTDPSAIITLRVFVFDTQESCDAWWAEKYEADEAKELYRPVDIPDCRAIDSLQMTKRIVSLGNVWMSCHQLQSSDAHLEVLDRYLDKIRGM